MLSNTTHKTLYTIQSIRSFASRSRTASNTQNALFEELWPQYGLHEIHNQFDGVNLSDFRSGKDIILDIGFGDGRSLCHLGQTSEDKIFIGVEVYKRGIIQVLSEIASLQLSNIRLVWGDVTRLAAVLPAGGLTGVQVFFPDPWPKSRHHKRRLISGPFVETLAFLLREGGILHLATDSEDYARQMMSVLSSSPKFHNKFGPNQFAERPLERPQTKYEDRALKAGRLIRELIFERSTL